MEARRDARLSPGTIPEPPHALLPTHIRLQKKEKKRLHFAWPVTNGHHCTLVMTFIINSRKLLIIGPERGTYFTSDFGQIQP